MRIFNLLVALLFATALVAQTSQADSVQFPEKLQDLEAKNQALQKKCDNLSWQLKQLENKVNRQTSTLDSLSGEVAQHKSTFATTTQTIGSQIEQTNTHVSTTEKRLQSNSLWGIILGGVILIVSLLLTLLLHKKNNKNVVELKKQADELQGKVVDKLSEDIAELQKITQQLVSTTTAPTEDNHDLVKLIADRITFMEMTLYKMDSSVRGYKQLTKSIEQMKNNLLANGYEIVSMLGKEYNDGMRVTANFVEDESLDKGKQIITSIIKPQINYKGVMIQSAQITVSQNI